MANAFSQLDTSFPSMDGKNTEAKIQAIQDYLYQLLEQLRYTLNNLNPDNFNETEVNDWAGETIVKPIHAEIVDTANGLITYIDATAAGVTVNVQKEYAAEWTSGTRYNLNDFVKVTTVNSDQTETVNFYKCIYDDGEGHGHVAADTNKPGSGTAWQTYWVQVAAADVAYSRFDITADAIRTEVSRAQGAELSLTTSITQTADAIRLEASRVYAPLWDSNGTYYKNNIVHTESGTPVVVKYWMCTADSTTQNPLDVSQTDWLEVPEANILNSRFQVTADAITSEVSRATAAEGNLSTSISQTADEIRLEASRVYAPLWDSNATYYKNNVVRTESGTPVTVTYWQCTAGSTTQNPLDVSQTDWVQISAPAANSQIVQSADEIKAQVTDDQGNYTVLNLKSDGLHVGNAQGTTTIDGSSITTGTVTANEIDANYVYAGDISADQIKAGTLDATNITLQEAFTVKAKDSHDVLQDCGLIGGYAGRSGTNNDVSMTSMDELHGFSAAVDGAEIFARTPNATAYRGDINVVEDEIMISVSGANGSTYIDIEPTSIIASRKLPNQSRETVDLLQPSLPLYRFTDMGSTTQSALLSCLNNNNSDIPVGPSAVICGASGNYNRCMVMICKSAAATGRGYTISPYSACNGLTLLLGSNGWSVV